MFLLANFQGSFHFCLFVLGADEQIRCSEFLSLPHQTTLNKYTGFTTIRTVRTAHMF